MRRSQKDNTMCKQPKLGDCYPKSLEFASDANKLMDTGKIPRQDISIVHGSIVPMNGPDAGRNIKHSWVELERFK